MLMHLAFRAGSLQSSRSHAASSVPEQQNRRYRIKRHISSISLQLALGCAGQQSDQDR